MNNKGVGAVFCLIAAILVSAKYIAAAMFMSGISNWSVDLFRTALSCIGPLPTILAVAALAVGVIFLGIGLVRDQKDPGK